MSKTKEPTRKTAKLEWKLLSIDTDEFGDLFTWGMQVANLGVQLRVSHVSEEPTGRFGLKRDAKDRWVRDGINQLFITKINQSLSFIHGGKLEQVPKSKFHTIIKS